jgi:hypothetical protein
MEDNEKEWKTTNGMEDKKLEWKTINWNGRQRNDGTRDRCSVQRIYLQQLFGHSFLSSELRDFE